MSINQIINIWNEFWFAKQSPLPLCVLRICYGLLVLAYALQWRPELMAFFGPHAMVSAGTMQAYEISQRFSLLFMLPQTEQSVIIVWSLLLVSSLLVIAGMGTRFALMLAFTCLLSFQHRNLLILHSGDTFLRIIGLLLIFAPAGAMLSVDSLFKKKSQEELTYVWPLRLIQLQIFALYCQTFFGKCAGNTWWDGTAVYYASRLEDFTRFSVPYVFDHMWTCQMFTWGALGIEFALWALIWVKELRYFVLLAGCFLHMGIEWSMNIPFFELTMIAAYVTFIEPKHIARCLSALSTAWNAGCRQLQRQFRDTGVGAGSLRERKVD